jgi:hypothetical protein
MTCNKVIQIPALRDRLFAYILLCRREKSGTVAPGTQAAAFSARNLGKAYFTVSASGGRIV